jgi:DNA primase catalytic core
MDKPSILEVIGQRVDLRRSGKEYTGLCPFHEDKNPSFSVNEEKGLFHCFGCAASGDVFDFIMQLDGVTFAEAHAQLGISSTRPHPKAPDPVKNTAAIIAEWADELTSNCNEQLREIGQRARISRLAGWDDEINLLRREWIVLESLADDLQDHKFIIELWRERETVEMVVGVAVE